jgi:hypothetical protein
MSTQEKTVALGVRTAPELAETLFAGGSPAGSAAAPPSGERRYEPRRELGRGGMGRVLEAADRQFNRVVAVKELIKGDDPGLRARFVTEALVTGNLEHPGIASVYERGVREDGSLFYAMRLVRGRTLAQALEEAHGLEERLALLPVLVQAAQTLAYAHERGVIHRDIKPANIITGPHGETVILDWGIAKVRGLPTSEAGAAEAGGAEGATHYGSVMGTPAYMSPEQAAGRLDELDERTDVFALGAILYHLLSGQKPYEAGTAQGLVAKAAEGRPAPLSREAPKAPEGLRRICERAMARAPEARYRSAAEMAKDLEAFLSSAVAGRESSLARRLGDVIGGFGILVAGIGSAATVGGAISLLHELGMGAIATMIWAGGGMTLALLEWRTRGRYALHPLCLAFALTTLLAGIIATLTGLLKSLGIALEPEVIADALAPRDVLLRGLYEALGNVVLGAALAVMPLMLWGVARRRALQTKPAA